MTLWLVGEWSAPLLAGRLHSPSPWYPLSKLVMLVTLVTKLLGGGGAADDRDDGPAEVAPIKQVKFITIFEETESIDVGIIQKY